MSAGNHLPNLDKIFRDDEEPDFLPSGGSNLAAIFGMQSKGPDISSSTKHVSQKKSTSGYNTPQPVSLNKLDIIIAKAVHTFKLKNGQYGLVGKLGMALIGNTFTRTYQIILYNSKQEHLSTVTLTHDFSYTVQPNNYTSYYDSNHENWSILFESNEACVEFTREVALARYFLKQGKAETIVYQDLTVTAKDMAAKEGDNVIVKYFIASEIKQPFKSTPSTMQTMTVSISTDDSWERNLLGSNKGLKRVLFLPPSKQISLGPSFPKQTDIMLEIEVTDICPPEENCLPPKQGMTGKAALLSRMARMGQSMLPKMPVPATTDSEDTEDDVPQRSPRHKKVESSEASVQKKPLPQVPVDDLPQNSCKVVRSRSEVPFVDSNPNKPLVSASTFTSQWSPMQLPSNFVTADGHLYTPQSQPIPAIMDPSLNMCLSEMRITNAEVRMGMSKVSDNVQKLLNKFHALELQNAMTSSNDRSIESSLKTLIETLKHNERVLSANEVNDDRTTALWNELKMSKDVSHDNVEHASDAKQRKRLENLNAELTEKIVELAASVNEANSTLKKTAEDLEIAKNLASQRDKDIFLLNSKISELTKENEILKFKMATVEQKDPDNTYMEVKCIIDKFCDNLNRALIEKIYSLTDIKLIIQSVRKDTLLQVSDED